MTQLLQTFTASSGKLSAKIVFDDNTSRHLHSTVYPEKESDYYESLEWFGDIVVFAGIGLGYHLLQKIKTLPKNSICIVIDYFEECIQHSKKTLFDTTENKVWFLSAINYQVQLATLAVFFTNNKGLSLQIIKHPSSYNCNTSFYNTIIEEIASHNKFQKLAKPPREKKVLLFFGSFFLEEEIKRAFESLNIPTLLFHYKSYTHSLEFETNLSRLIQQENPDFILSVNMKGFDGNGITGQTAKRCGIPLVVWFVDDPRPILLSSRQHIDTNAIAFCWEKAYLPLLRESCFNKAEYLPLAADPQMANNIFPHRIVTQLGFVGTAMVDEFAGKIKDKFLWSNKLLPFVNKFSNALLQDKTFDTYASLQRIIENQANLLPFSDQRNLTWFTTYIIHHTCMLKRKQVVECLIPLGIETFGDPQGWKSLFGETLVTHESIDYRHDLSNVYKSIAVNINSTNCQMPTAVNQRVFDIPMSNSFVITDNQADLFELFDKTEIVVYQSYEELQDKATFYLKNETERLPIITKAKQRILNQHTYAHRITTLLNKL